MKCLDKFNKKMAISGGSLRSENIQNSKMFLENIFDDDASLSLNIYFWELGIQSYEGHSPLRIRLYERKFSTANGSTMKFQTLNDTPIIVGDIVYNSEANEYWICTESFDIDGIHFQGKFTQCNWILKWQNDKGEILEYPCQDINATQYNSGERSNQQFVIGSAQHMLTLPADENTIMLSTPQRIYLDRNMIHPTSYVVTQNDTSSYNYGKKGLCKVTVTQCVEDSKTDRPDLGICDYVDFSNIVTDVPVENEKTTAKILYSTTKIKSGGSSQVFKSEFQDSNGNKITGIIPIWDIVCDFKEHLEVKKSGNDIEIGIDNDDYVDEEFKLILSDSDLSCETYLIITVDSLL